MRKTTKYILGLCTALGMLAGCDNGFDELNTNKNLATAINPLFSLNTAIVNTAPPGTTLPYELAIVQQIVSPNSGVIAGGNFNEDNRPVTRGLWENYYRNVLKNTADVIAKTRDNPARSNLYNMARIIHANAGMILTDTYGDIPFTEAGQGFLNNVVTPSYDAQQDIYETILTELDQASAGLDAAKALETQDALYGGDITKWRRLGYSLLLRAAMRLTKADAAKAQSYAAKAAAAGVMQSNADNAFIRHTAAFMNAVGNTLNSTEANNYYLTETFVKYLKAAKDPRLASIAVRYVGAKNGAEQVAARINRDTTVQIGMPMGYDNASIASVVTAKGLASFYDFSQLDRNRMGRNDAPNFLVTYAQTQLLLAEAVVRGWVTGDAAALYTNGIKAHMEQLSAYADAAVPATSIDAYLAANPFDPAKALEQINTQYWVASFLNGPEAFANFRRSGFPNLPPNPLRNDIDSEDFIRRLTYPDAELSVNSGNYQEAVSRQGLDRLDTRVWWDK
ncbi:SusD/RagB family nutrient-binding outer membrane lipoprotein [Rhodocytophaga aerolata]|uniref:SusD/RagB family nutrient-binding outer membrane lipoprotein n=1 Tax=Rhodocytophaga aerolata TaxID=455078 RepID=A0ABT8QXZ4_9BACT|nr:SusD/RagB family nutrient-binding outer membrane lipoprotein [Rhodocytophaga aerolata]MDO1444707.1 SusD/RagB family nutrient-binding outer membrane lipoprotein [Rhodocytophaga aerolata]